MFLAPCESVAKIMRRSSVTVSSVAGISPKSRSQSFPKFSKVSYSFLKFPKISQIFLKFGNVSQNFRKLVTFPDINAERDIVHINITSRSFLFNILRQIASGWVFQLNGAATFSFYRNAVDMIGFGVNSVGNHNHPLCWSIILHHTESELM
jgi:hypothetical protein